MRIQSWDQEDPLEEETATHFNNLAWKIPWTEESGGLQSMGSQRVGTILKRLSMPAQNTSRTFLVAQWKRICLAMQGT